MPSCRELTELVTEYLEGRMDFATRLRFRVHLGLCRHCRVYLDQMKKTIAAAHKMPAEPLPPEIERELATIFRDWKSRPDRA